MKTFALAALLLVAKLWYSLAFTPAVSNSLVVRANHPVPTTSLTTTSLAMSTQTSTGPEIEVVSQPDQEFLEKKGVFNWGTWGCGVSKFPWTYDSAESCYLLAGQVTVTPSDGRAPATFGKGDFVTFPAGMSCTWDVSEAVQKHFLFH